MIWMHTSIKNRIINHTYGSEKIIEEKVNIGRKNFSVFEFYVPEEGRFEVNDKIRNQLQEMLKLTKMITSYFLET
jgi:hypothetical protein